MHTYSFLLIAALATSLTTPRLASAQKAPAKPAPAPSVSSAARAEALTTNMTQALGLTPAQQEKVRAINTNSVRNVETARQRYGQEPAKLRGYIDDVSLARLDQLKDVLTPAQFARYQQKREEKMGIPTIRGNQGTPPPGLPSNRGDD
jgi:Spy/CpxP family protein refolding chaperone